MDQRTILYRNSQQTHDHGAIVGGCDPNTPSENVAWGNSSPSEAADLAAYILTLRRER